MIHQPKFSDGKILSIVLVVIVALVGALLLLFIATDASGSLDSSREVSSSAILLRFSPSPWALLFRRMSYGFARNDRACATAKNRPKTRIDAAIAPTRTGRYPLLK
jgi:hypothetical protein